MKKTPHFQIVILALCAFLLFACKEAKQTIIPADALQNESFKATLEKLTPDERESLAKYFIRQKMGEAFGQGPGVTAGLTIQQALNNEKDFEATQRQREAEQKALQEKIKAERTAAIQKMNDAVTVALTRKELVKDRFLERIEIKLAFANKSDKEISGIKGLAVFKNQFGDTIQKSGVEFDEDLPAHGQKEVERSRHFNQFDSDDVKFAGTEFEKIKMEFEPLMIIFKDGSKLEAPDNL